MGETYRKDGGRTPPLILLLIICALSEVLLEVCSYLGNCYNILILTTKERGGNYKDFEQEIRLIRRVKNFYVAEK